VVTLTVGVGQVMEQMKLIAAIKEAGTVQVKVMKYAFSRFV
jgi:hypothetical protein